MKYFLKEDRFLPEMHLKHSRLFMIISCGDFLKERKNSKICTNKKYKLYLLGMIWIKIVFSMIWLMVNINI